MSPYLSDATRLADVVAAIQATGSYKFYKLDFSGWSDRITGDENNAGHWKLVFVQHPEFFRLDSKKERVSLILRRQQPKLFNVDTGKAIAKLDFDQLVGEQRERISRQPLDSNQIEALIGVAISLHARAAEQARDKRWWVAPLLAFAGALLGAAISTVLKDNSDKPVTAQLSVPSTNAARISH